MRRLHVYQRSATLAARGSRLQPVGDYGPAARATIAALPELLILAEACGAVTLERFLGQALTEAEEIARRAGRDYRVRRARGDLLTGAN